MVTRRGLITGLISFVAAPAIVRVESIMPVKLWKPTFVAWGDSMVYGAPDGFTPWEEAMPGLWASTRGYNNNDASWKPGTIIRLGVDLDKWARQQTPFIIEAPK